MKDLIPRLIMLQELPIFKYVTENELTELNRNSEVINIKKDEHIFTKGDEISHVYIVINGAIKVGANVDFQKSIIRQLAHKGEIFGENIMSKNITRTGFAQALANSNVLAIPKNTFQRLLNSNPNFCNEVISHILNQLNELEKRITDFVYKKAQNRIEGFIKKLALKKGIKIGLDEILIKHNLSHSDIAYLTDTSRQTVSRVLGELKKDNILHFTPRKPQRLLVRNLGLLA